MNSIKNIIKTFLNKFAERFSGTEKITDDQEYTKVKKRVHKTQKSYKNSAVFSVFLSIVLTVLICILLKQNGLNPILVALLGIFMLLVYVFSFVLAGWGMKTMNIHFKEVAKSAWKAARFGYQIGETIKTTHVDVTHEFGNTYKVSSRTEDKGLLFGCIAMFCIMAAWAGYCVYKGTFLTFKKIKNSKINLVEYKNSKI